MALDFKQEEIKNIELKLGTTFAGFINPRGDLVYSGPTHYFWNSSVYNAYLKYISYIVSDVKKDGKYANYIKEQTPDIYNSMLNPKYDELVFRGYDSYYFGVHTTFEEFYRKLLKRIETVDYRIREKEELSFDRFKLDLLNFFKDAYRDKDYIKATGKVIRIDSQNSLEEKIKKENNITDQDKSMTEILIERAVNKEMLAGFKDICVQYLGYDTVERYGPNSKEIQVPPDEISYDENFYNSPRIITSSYKDIYERFYNYLLMDWEIYKVPRFIYNKETGIFEKEQDILNAHRAEKEEETKEEIQSIKKMVPPWERKQFFKR